MLDALNKSRKTKVLLKLLSGALFMGAVLAGLLMDETEAQAFTCNGGVCLCGEWDIDPTTGLPKLPSGDHTWDCQDLHAYCERQDAQPNVECDFEGNLGGTGGQCSCTYA